MRWKGKPDKVTLTLSAYRWLIRFLVEILEVFPPARVEKEEIELRKGFYEPLESIADSTIWIHGASLGEVITLRPFLAKLSSAIGKKRILASATTLDGYKQLLADGLCGHVTLLPIEIPEILEPFLDKMKPALVIISETEIWPLWLATLAKRSIPYGIVNARINEKTVRFLKLLRPLFVDAIKNLAFVFPQDAVYANRFHSLGIPKEKIAILGCFKYDIEDSPKDEGTLRKKYGIPPGRRIICFGSTHSGEEEMLLEALDPLWNELNATVIIAPRHMKRVAEVESIIRGRHLDFSRLSEGKKPAGHVILVDTMGELRNLYALSSLVFVGGSLIPHGGHNLMEPAYFGVPIITGSHTSNFPTETQALRKAQAVFEVKNVETLRSILERFTTDPAQFSDSGKRAKAVLKQLSGATGKTLKKLREMDRIPHA